MYTAATLGAASPATPKGGPGGGLGGGAEDGMICDGEADSMDCMHMHEAARKEIACQEVRDT